MCVDVGFLSTILIACQPWIELGTFINAKHVLNHLAMVQL